jgi:putative redox protein
MNSIECRTEKAGDFPQQISVRAHALRADLAPTLGGTDSAPGPHDYFDAALAACKTLTAHWYAKHKGFPLERAEVRVERDDADERKGVYRLRVHLTFHGPLTDEQRAALSRAVGACPIHKLMTSSEVQIETVG